MLNRNDHCPAPTTVSNLGKFSISYLLYVPLRENASGFRDMRVWIDILTPKHALFFEPLYRDLVSKGHELLLTTRTYREAEEALELKKLGFHVIGEHGGATRIGKLLASGRRIVKLAQLIESWRPDTAASFSSPEAARVAFGLGIPHVTANDSPHIRPVARLTIPLSRYVCPP